MLSIYARLAVERGLSRSMTMVVERVPRGRRVLDFAREHLAQGSA